MTDRHDPVRDQAIEWAIRLGDPAFADWDGFTAWLEADPAHRETYETVIAAEELADEALRHPTGPLIQSASSEALILPHRPLFPRLARGLAAAAMIGALGWAVVMHRPAPYAIETRRGEHRIVSLGAATIAMNGGTRLELDRHNPHIATLDRGEALFDVVHDEAHPFTVHVGEAEVRDVGTRFDVTREGQSVRVAVAEGSVVYNPGAEAVRLGPGELLATTDGAEDLRLTDVAAADIGGWREDRLSYQQAPLSTVAADLSRGLGIDIEAAPEVAQQSFTGVIAYGGDRDHALARLGPLLDVKVKHSHERWLLTRKPHSRR